MTARRLYGGIAGWAAALLAFYISLHYNWARPEIYLVLALSIAIYFFFEARNGTERKSKYASFLCGFFIFSTIEGHFYGIAFAIIFSLIHIYEQLRYLQKNRISLTDTFVFFIFGCASFSLFWLWYHLYLPGVSITDLPLLFSNNMSWEMGVAHYKSQGLLSIFEKPYILVYTYYKDFKHEFYLLLFLVIVTIVRGKNEDRVLLSVLIWRVGQLSQS